MDIYWQIERGYLVGARLCLNISLNTSEFTESIQFVKFHQSVRAGSVNLPKVLFGRLQKINPCWTYYHTITRVGH